MSDHEVIEPFEFNINGVKIQFKFLNEETIDSIQYYNFDYYENDKKIDSAWTKKNIDSKNWKEFVSAMFESMAKMRLNKKEENV